ncbi:MAG TPA: HNH endonuclease signature motif containing protein [Stellaceae bacterium]|nr:HNH endonuclease signature motif containing protein [Stellaceae bacterium]
MARPFLSDVAFWRQVAIDPFPEACWPWTGSLKPNGYGYTRFRGKSNVLVRRVAYQLENGPISAGLVVCHRCDWRRCRNPNHLFLATQTENMVDMRAKGRGYVFEPRHGERHGRCTATDADVAEIRWRYALEGVSQTELGRLYGIKQSQVDRIVRGESRTVING